MFPDLQVERIDFPISVTHARPVASFHAGLSGILMFPRLNALTLLSGYQEKTSGLPCY